MSFNASTSDVPDFEGYDELEQQTFQMAVGLPDESSLSGSGPVLYQVEHEPLGGSLSRGEMAEIVTFEGHGIFVISNNNVSGPGAEHTWWELSMSGEPQAIGNQQLDQAADEPGTLQMVEDGNSIGAGNLTDTQAKSVAHDVIHYLSPHQQTPWEDATNGTGGGGSMHMDHSHRNFRHLYGTGPLLDNDTTLFEHIIAGISGNSGTIYRNFTLTYNVFEVADLPRVGD